MAHPGKRPSKPKSISRGSGKTRARLDDTALREQLAQSLNWDHAHPDFASVLDGWPESRRGAKPDGAPHTPWQLLEHMRIAQWDILEFSRNPDHVSPEFPSGYWPATDTRAHRNAWNRSVRALREDTRAMQELALDPVVDLCGRIPHGTGQTILREILLVADHNAYHLGQLMLLKKMLGVVPGR